MENIKIRENKVTGIAIATLQNFWHICLNIKIFFQYHFQSSSIRLVLQKILKTWYAYNKKKDYVLCMHSTNKEIGTGKGSNFIL